MAVETTDSQTPAENFDITPDDDPFREEVLIPRYVPGSTGNIIPSNTMDEPLSGFSRGYSKTSLPKAVRESIHQGLVNILPQLKTIELFQPHPGHRLT